MLSTCVDHPLEESHNLQTYTFDARTLNKTKTNQNRPIATVRRSAIRQIYLYFHFLNQQSIMHSSGRDYKSTYRPPRSRSHSPDPRYRDSLVYRPTTDRMTREKSLERRHDRSSASTSTQRMFHADDKHGHHRSGRREEYDSREHTMYYDRDREWRRRDVGHSNSYSRSGHDRPAEFSEQRSHSRDRRRDESRDRRGDIDVTPHAQTHVSGAKHSRNSTNVSHSPPRHSQRPRRSPRNTNKSNITATISTHTLYAHILPVHPAHSQRPLMVNLDTLAQQQYPQYEKEKMKVKTSAARLLRRVGITESALGKRMEITSTSPFNRDAAIAEITTSSAVNSAFVLKYTNAFFTYRDDAVSSAAASAAASTTASLIVTLDMPEQKELLIDQLNASRDVLSTSTSTSSKSSTLSKVVTVERLCKWWVQMLLGVQAMHQVNVLHNDIKVTNIMWSNSDSDRVCIIDFGNARVCHTDTSVSFTLDHSLTSPHFRAPEIWSAQTYGFPSDVYSLGMVFLQLLFANHKLHIIEMDGNAITKPTVTLDKIKTRQNLFQAQQKVFYQQKHRWSSQNQNPLGDTRDDMLGFLMNLLSERNADAVAIQCDDEVVEMQLLQIIASMLVFNPSQRVTIVELLQHPLLKPIAAQIQTTSAVPHLPPPPPPPPACPQTMNTVTMAPIVCERRQELLQHLWTSAVSFPMHSVLVASHILTRLCQLRGDDNARYVEPRLDVAGSLLLSAQLHGLSKKIYATAVGVAHPVSSDRVYTHAWSLMHEMDGHVLSGFRSGPMLQTLVSTVV